MELAKRYTREKFLERREKEVKERKKVKFSTFKIETKDSFEEPLLLEATRLRKKDYILFRDKVYKVLDITSIPKRNKDIVTYVYISDIFSNSKIELIVDPMEIFEIVKNINLEKRKYEFIRIKNAKIEVKEGHGSKGVKRLNLPKNEKLLEKILSLSYNKIDFYVKVQRLYKENGVIEEIVKAELS